MSPIDGWILNCLHLNSTVGKRSFTVEEIRGNTGYSINAIEESLIYLQSTLWVERKNNLYYGLTQKGLDHFKIKFPIRLEDILEHNFEVYKNVQKNDDWRGFRFLRWYTGPESEYPKEYTEVIRRKSAKSDKWVCEWLGHEKEYDSYNLEWNYFRQLHEWYTRTQK